jgi:RNA polymerase sigma factor (sigma-70 family)
MQIIDYNSLSDEELIAIIRNDNRSDLFVLLYNRYFPKVFDKAYSLLKNKSQAKESVQEIMTKVFEKLDSFKGLSSFSSWIYSITYNYCIDYLRSYKKLHYPDWNIKNELPEIIDETEEDFHQIKYDRLIEVMELIHPEEKAMLMMKYNDNLSIKQIAVAMRITESAAKMRIKRAKARLVFQYKKLYSEYNI